MSKHTQKAFKRSSAATRYRNEHCPGTPILRVGAFYIVGIDSLTSVELIAAPIRRTIGEDTYTTSTIVGHVTAGHLDRLGNANWATAQDPITKPREFAFASTKERIEREIARSQTHKEINAS